MPNHLFAKRCSIVAAALAAVAGTLILPTSAEAGTCDFQFGNSFAIAQSDGNVVRATPKGPKNLAGGQQQATMSGNGQQVLGNPNGQIVGDRLQLSIQWEGLGFRAMPGQINPDGSVTGKVQAVDRDVATYSGGPGTIKCSQKVPQQQPQPQPVPDKPSTKTFGTATVVKDTDIYDKPDGMGTKIGTLFVGESHPLMEPCRDDWCRVGAIELGGFPGLPNGTAWVYSKDYLTFS